MPDDEQAGESTPAPPPEQPDETLLSPAALSPAERRALLSALLFTSGEKLDADRLAQFLAVDEAALRILAEEAAGELRALGLDILDAAGGYRMLSAAQWDPWLGAFHRQVRKAKLGKSALEILAVIAYEQPVSRTRVDELRQVNSESTVRSLLDRRLITVAGRADTPGRPFLYRTTEYFLEVFGLSSLADLPPRPADLRALGTQGEDEEEGVLHISGEVDE
jgi:segregation and condensation protein B